MCQSKNHAQDPSVLWLREDEAAKTYMYAGDVQDQRSISQCTEVQVQGVPVYDLIDTGPDISVIGGKLFKPQEA